MWRLTIENLKTHWGRYVASIITIMLATAFAMGTLMFGAGIANSFQWKEENRVAGVDLKVEVGDIGAEGESGAKVFDRQLELAQKVRDMPDVEAIWSADPEIFKNDKGDIISTAVLPGGDKNVLVPQEGGTYPTEPGQILLNYTEAKDLKAKVGDELKFTGPSKRFWLDDHPPQDGEGDSAAEFQKLANKWAQQDPENYARIPYTYKVVGIATERSSKQLTGTSYITLADSQKYNDNWFVYYVKVKPGTEEKVKSEIQNLYQPFNPKDTNSPTSVKTQSEVVDIEMGRYQGAQLIISAMFLIFPAIAMIVAIIIVSSTFRVVQGERRKEIALMRCIGASKQQLKRTLVAEQLVVGAVSALLGIVLGIAVSIPALWYFELAGSWKQIASTISWWMIVALFILGLLITLFAGIGPARALQKISPIQALSLGAEEETSLKRRLRMPIGAAIMILVGVPTAIYGINAGIEKFGFTVLGTALGVLGTLMIGSFLAPNLIGTIGKLGQRSTTQIAGQNVRQNPGRTSATVAALALSVGLVTMMMVGAATVRGSVDATLDRAVGADVTLTSFSDTDLVPEDSVPADAPKQNPVEAGTKALEKYLKDPHFVATNLVPRIKVNLVNPDSSEVKSEDWNEDDFDRAALQENGGVAKLTNSEPPQAEDNVLYVIGANEGYYRDLTKDGKLVLKSIDLQGKKHTLEVRVQEIKPGMASNTISKATMESLGGPNAIPQFVGNLKPTDDQQEQVDYLKELQNDVERNFALKSPIMVKAQIYEAVDIMLLSVTALLSVSVLVAMIGVANTLILSVSARKREFGLLRALGMTSGQTKGMVLWEALVSGICGALLGVILGVVAAYAGIKGLNFSRTIGDGLGTEVFTIPWLQILGALAVVVVAATIAALIPARRAGKATPIQALA
ncbi:hypothetical protein BSR29_05030 [Boudabousia liubingyangii]|uniref:ABC3 transporter permease C-terminal domain-containing protein n=1 Tax=Boudabousia liubingyangii TaxID=1921764 RepID=A0A1Q5PLC8_9ACTO|nr:FtsX-like permease family protein [Boudabousia liubingyangii]OKL47858.1 hypothetical protein BSR29_05030 [Boudabousia liubingyangii]